MLIMRKHATILFPMLLLSFVALLAYPRQYSRALLSSTSPAMETLLVKQLSAQLLRLHIVANSDTDADQAVKLQVRDAVIAYLSPLLHEVSSRAEAETLITEKLPALSALAADCLAEQGFSYGASASLETAAFPIKAYGDIVLPAGDYRALQIRLGAAEGQNWWCIAFPQLCFVDETVAVVPEDSKEALKFLLTTDAYSAILNQGEAAATDETTVTVRFWLIDWLCSLFSKK